MLNNVNKRLKKVFLNPIQDGRPKKPPSFLPPNNFSPVTFINVGISPLNVLIFSFNSIVTLV